MGREKYGEVKPKMKKCKKFLELMDGYIQGKLSETDKEAVEQHYFECNRCFEQLQFQEKMLGAIQNQGETLFAEYIKKREPLRKPFWSRLLDRLFPRVPIWRRAWICAAAGLILLAVLLPTIYRLTSPNPYAGLVQFEAYPYVSPGLRNGAGPAERRFEEGMQLYKVKEFGEAAEKLERAIAMNPEKAEAHFYLGICYLFEEKSKGAITSFRRALDLKPAQSTYQWYLGQAYLQKGKGKSALQEFQDVLRLGERYSKDAEKMIEKINKITE